MAESENVVKISNIAVGGVVYVDEEEEEKNVVKSAECAENNHEVEDEDFSSDEEEPDIEEAHGILSLLFEAEERKNKDENDNFEPWKVALSISWLIAYQRFERERKRVNKLVVKEGICTEKDSDGVPIDRQGDLELYSNHNLQKRKALIKQPPIVQAIQDIWEVAELANDRDEKDTISRDCYMELNIKFQHVITPHPVSPFKATKVAAQDWYNDTDGGKYERMGYEAFEKSMFQIADTWSIGTGIAEYVEVLEILLKAVTCEIEDDEEIQSKEAAEKEKVPDLSTKANTIPKSKEKFKRAVRGLIKNNSMIKQNQTFADVAMRKFDDFSEFWDRIKSGKDAKKRKGLITLSATISQIVKIYEEMIVQDKKHHAKNGLRATSELDRFIVKNYQMRYGSKKLARKHVKRLIKTAVMYQKVPRIRLFLKLAGVYVKPLKGETPNFGYDPHVASEYALPLLQAVTDVQKFESLLGRNEEAFVLRFAFESGLRKICRRIPYHSAYRLEVFEKIKELSISGSGAGEKNMPSMQSVAVQKAKKFGSFKKRTSLKMTSRVALNNLRKCDLVDLDKALLVAHNLFEIDKKWALVYKYVVSAKAIAKWVHRAFQEKRKLSKEIGILSKTPTNHCAIDCSSFASTVISYSAVRIVEKLTGEELQDVLEFHKSQEMIERKTSENTTSNVLPTIQNRKSGEKKKSENVILADALDISKSCSEKEQNKEVIFTPSPRTPRAILEEARERDKSINNGLQ